MTESQNGGGWKGLWKSSGPILFLLKQGQPNQDHVQTDSKSPMLHGGSCHNHAGQCVPVLCHLHCKEVLPDDVQADLCVFPFCAHSILSCHRALLKRAWLHPYCNLQSCVYIHLWDPLSLLLSRLNSSGSLSLYHDRAKIIKSGFTMTSTSSSR